MNIDMSSINKQVKELFKTDSTLTQRAYKSKGLVANLRVEVNKLKSCILKYTVHDSVLNSIDIKQEADGSFTVYFDKGRGSYPSFFEAIYPVDAYMPLLRNEGYELKNPRWKKFFGKGGSGEAEHFVEKGIQDYISTYGDNLNIKVTKVYDTKYSPNNLTIYEETDY